jgi:glycine cleavage system H protein
MNTPDNLRYAESHTWAELLEDNLVRVGITDHAQEELGDIVFVELPEVDRHYASGGECAVVESVKSASDIYCPITGEVIEINDELADSPEKINTDPYGDGWIFIVRPGDLNELDDLIDANAYNELVEA